MTTFVCLRTFYRIHGSDYSLRGLYVFLREVVGESRKASPEKPVCLLVDGLSVVTSVGVSVTSVVDFAHYCQQMLCTPDGLCKVGGVFVF